MAEQFGEDFSSRLRRVVLLALFLFFLPVGIWITVHYFLPRELAWLSKNEFLHTVNLLTIFIGLIVIAAAPAASLFIGENRSRLGIVFRPLIAAVMVLVTVTTIFQAGLFIYIAYQVGKTTISWVPGQVFLILGIVSIICCWNLVNVGFRSIQLQPIYLNGIYLNRENQQKIYQLVEHVAHKLGACTPDQIVLGLEPVMFVTSSPVKLSGTNGQLLTGNTLCLSVGLMHLLSVNELTAIIGHELGHFRGKDLDYSRRFVPIYTRLIKIIEHTEPMEGEGIGAFAKLPAFATLHFYLTEFSRLERKIHRERELLADHAAFEATSKSGQALALVKTALYSPLWNFSIRKHFDAVSKQNISPNFSQAYKVDCEALFMDLNWDDEQIFLLGDAQAHPFDSHPTLAERLAICETTIADIGIEDLKPNIHSSASLIDDIEFIETTLSQTELPSIRWQMSAQYIQRRDIY